MLNVLLTATPLHGHVLPMVSIGSALLERGHRVTLLTGVDFEALATRNGLRFRALPAEADFRSQRSSACQGSRRPRVLHGRDAILDTFVRPLDAQYSALNLLLSESSWDAVLSDAAYLGTLPLLLSPLRPERPPILGISATPLSLNSDDCAPFGAALQPGEAFDSPSRNRRIRWLLRHGPLRQLHQRLDDVLARHGIPRGTADYFDHAAYFDATFHLAPPEMEYPRRDQPETISFVGPIPSPSAEGPLPDWWRDLDDDPPVVHVTQGTLDNGDPRKLLLPSIRGLAGEDVLVVVATGGLPVSRLIQAYGEPLPRNVRAAEFLAYDQLLPRADAGIDLRTGTPSPRRIRRAVLTALNENSYRANAQRVGRSIARARRPADHYRRRARGIGARADSPRCSTGRACGAACFIPEPLGIEGGRHNSRVVQSGPPRRLDG